MSRKYLGSPAEIEASVVEALRNNGLEVTETAIPNTIKRIKIVEGDYFRLVDIPDSTSDVAIYIDSPKINTHKHNIGDMYSQNNDKGTVENAPGLRRKYKKAPHLKKIAIRRRKKQD